MYRLAYFLLLISMPALSQVKNDFVSYNKITFELYEKQDWDKLIITGKEALQNEFDFFYLRVRLGIAYYEKGNFSKAINHLEKALLFNDSDPAVLEYLYFAHILSNRYQEASRLYYKHIQIFKGKDLSIRPRVFDMLTLQGGIKVSDQYIELGTQVENISYGFLGASINLKGRFNLYQYAGILSQGFTDKFIYQDFLYYYKYYFKQFEYYVSGNLLLGKGWSINPAYHLIRVDVISRRYNDYYYGLSVIKNFNKVRLGINISKAYMLDTDVIQLVPEISYYPLGNTKLYFTLRNTSNKSGDNDIENQVFGKMGLKIFSKTWLEGFYAYGKTQFLACDNGYILYNNPDYLISRGGVTISQYFKNNMQIILSYQLENKEQFNSEDLYSHHFVMVGFNIKL